MKKILCMPASTMESPATILVRHLPTPNPDACKNSIGTPGIKDLEELLRKKAGALGGPRPGR